MQEFIVDEDIRKNLTPFFFSNSVEMARTMSLDRSPGNLCFNIENFLASFICLCVFRSISFFHRNILHPDISFKFMRCIVYVNNLISVCIQKVKTDRV